jgi:acyl-CoA synthetase (NDP forming)
MEYALSHQPTRVIALLIDSLPDGPRFRDLAARALRNGKDVVALKIGHSEAGARAAVAHSSRMAGDAAAYAALFEAAGVAAAASLEGLMTASALLARYGRQKGALGAMSTSGAGASLIADRCAALGVKLAPFTAETTSRIDSFRKFSRIGNPLDLGIFGGLKNARDVPTALMTDPGVGVALALVHSLNPWQGDPIRAGLFAGKEVSGKPLLIVSPGGMPADERALYETRGVDVFTETDIVLEGIGALLTPSPTPVSEPRPTAAPALPRRQLTEPESLRLLRGFGVPAVATRECRNLDDTIKAANETGYPIVLKGIVEGVAHKSDLGLVHAGLPGRDALESAYQRLNTTRVIVQPMIAGDLEVIAGVSRSPGVGLVLLAGLGGIYAEALRETVLWPLPAAPEAITAKLGNSAIGRVLTSPRWHHPNAMAAFTELLLHLQAAAQALSDQLEAIDINPVLLGAHGAIAVDALIVPRA